MTADIARWQKREMTRSERLLKDVFAVADRFTPPQLEFGQRLIAADVARAFAGGTALSAVREALLADTIIRSRMGEWTQTFAQAAGAGWLDAMRLVLPEMPKLSASLAVLTQTLDSAAVRDPTARSGVWLPSTGSRSSCRADTADPQLDGVDWCATDLADPDAPRRLVVNHVARFGALDALVAAHARSGQFDLATVTAAELDQCLVVNTRATLLLVQAAAAAGVRRVVLFTTGVHHDPMPEEIPYAASKAALQGLTPTLAASLAPQGATVNCINPGPTDTGYADPDTARVVAESMPLGQRWGTPQDCAQLVAWLLSDAAAWVTGQTIDSDGGWAVRTRSGR